MNKELTFLDIISILSFVLTVQNLDYNISEQDIANQTNILNQDLVNAINDVHEHLASQDEKLNIIMNRLEDM